MLSKGNLADLEDRSARNAAALAQRRARLRELDVDAALGDADATRARDEVAAEIEDLEEAQRLIAKDRDRVAGALAGLLERRVRAEAEAGQARTAAALEAWHDLQVQLAQAGRACAAAGARLVRLADEHPEIMLLVDSAATLWTDDGLAVIVRSADLPGTPGPTHRGVKSTTRVVVNPKAMQAVREAVAYGLLNFAFAVEGAWKKDAVVRGGHRSFMTGPKTKAGTARIGGTLRRSIHTVCYLDGKRIGAGTADARNSGKDGKTAKDVTETGIPNTVPDYPAPGKGIVAYIGSNSGYGAFVELGTSKMAARPAAVPALLRPQGPDA